MKIPRNSLVKNLLAIGLLLLIPIRICHAQTSVVGQETSPDHKTIVQFSKNDQGQLVYKMDFNGHHVIDWSVLGLQTNGPELSDGISVINQSKTEHRETFDWCLGEDSKIENNYNELILHCTSSNAGFDIVARVFNGSLAFRYVCKNITGTVKLNKELTAYNLADAYRIYQYHEESVFRPMDVNTLPGICDLPATLVSDHHLYISIGEADNRNDTKCVLIKGSKTNSLALDFYSDTAYHGNTITAVHKDNSVFFRDSLVTPWRTINCAESAIGLHDFSELNLKLVDPQNNKNPIWVKPGKVFRVQLTTQSAMDGVDLASSMNFQYIMLDGGWYGAEFRTVSDPTQPIPALDIPGIVSYAKSKGIGVILYVNYVGLKAKLDNILPLYKKWGISGMKFGFVDGGTQKGLTWLDSAMNKVNDYGFILNVHDHYKPTGLSRRYPYQLSQEGIRGDENSPDAFHTTVLPYTRFLAGPADFTFCYPNSKNAFSKNLKVSKGQQLALTVIYFDPLQAIFWYGKPKDYNPYDREIEFFKYVPTVWDESHYLQGEIGESISVVRRKGDTWFMGSAAGLNPWNTKIKLSFLKQGQKYRATIYQDNDSNGIDVKTIEVKADDQIDVELQAKGGQAIIIRPAK